MGLFNAICNRIFPSADAQILEAFSEVGSLSEGEFIDRMCSALGIDENTLPPPETSKARQKPEAVRLPADIQNALRVLRLNELPCQMVEIEKARKRLALEFHPDRGGSEQEMKNINAAYSTVRSYMAA